MKYTALISDLFSSRLLTLANLLDLAEQHYDGDEAFLTDRLIEDMYPLSTQVAFSCDQPRNFARWAHGLDAENLDPSVSSLADAKKLINDSIAALAKVPQDDAKLEVELRIPVGPDLYIDLSGRSYIDDFLMPNFYFHVVTAYNILRKRGLNIGKREYMFHLLPLVKEQ